MRSAQDETLDFLLAQVCKLHHTRARALFEAVGLYRGQPPVLLALAEREGLSHSELAGRFQVTPATISKMLERMEKAGFLTCRPDMEDQRVSRAYLTEQGRAVQEEMAGLLRTLEAETFGGFTFEERILLRRFLLQMRDNLIHVTNNAPPP